MTGKAPGVSAIIGGSSYIFLFLGTLLKTLECLNYSRNERYVTGSDSYNLFVFMIVSFVCPYLQCVLLFSHCS